MKKVKKVITLLLAVLVLCFGAFGVYVFDYYHAEETVVYSLADSEQVNIYSQNDVVVFQPQKAVAGFIFYPGGKVDCTAYAPLMKLLAENDILCVITKMPFNLAVFDINAAELPMEMFADITRWYIGGHSLGGAMAASYAAANVENIDGLVLLAAYSTEDLTDSGLEVLSVYGSEDGVLNMEKYNECYSNLPDDLTEIIIDGGNHRQFGSYGRQSGDGTPVISAQQQIYQTADAVANMIKE